jgi:hypothetical protein
MLRSWVIWVLLAPTCAAPGSDGYPVSGFCQATEWSDAGNLLNGPCPSSSHGAWWSRGLTGCLVGCERCKQCHFISFSPSDQDCSWFRDCPSVQKGEATTDYYLTHTTWQIRAADGTLLERPSNESRKKHSVLSYRGRDHASSMVAVAVRKADTSWNSARKYVACLQQAAEHARQARGGDNPAGWCRGGEPWPLCLPTRNDCKEVTPGDDTAHPPPPPVRLVVMSLLNNPTRNKWIDANRISVPTLSVFRCVDGRDFNATLRVLLESGLHYQRTCGHNVGMLSNALCRYGAFKEQADARAPWTAVIEDDAALSTHFMQYIGGLADALRGSEEHNTTIVQLGTFGEGYLTSLGTAKAIVRRFKERGIRDCPEPAYNGGRLLGQGTFKVHQHTPWRVMVGANQGDLGKTKPLPDGPCEMRLNAATATPERSAAYLLHPASYERLLANLQRLCGH